MRALVCACECVPARVRAGRQQRKSGRGQLAERLCQITLLVLWSKALERSSLGLPPHGAPTLCVPRMRVKRKVISITCINCFWSGCGSAPGDAGDAGDAGMLLGAAFRTAS